MRSQVLYDVLKFRTLEGLRGPEALIDPKTAGRKPKLNAAQRRALVQAVEDGPLPTLHGVVRWRLTDLKHWAREEFGTEISVQSLSRKLRALGCRKLSARPRHYAQDGRAMAAVEKNFPAKLAEVGAQESRAKDIEIWFQDGETHAFHRIGQKNKVARRRAKRGTRARAPRPLMRPFGWHIIVKAVK